MTFRIVPRTEIGLPAVVRSASGALRPPLSNEPYITAHYTGNNIDYTGRDGAEIVRQIQQVFSKTKPFEYNYCIDQSDDDRIFEFAGKFQAAHSGGENHLSFGVLFINGIHDPITPTQVKKWQWLRDALIFDGSLQPNVMQRRHREMPGAATACPGPHVDIVWLPMMQPYHPPYVPPPTIPESDDDMAVSAYLVVPPTSRTGKPWFVVVDGSVRPATSFDVTDGKLQRRQLTDKYSAEQYDLLHRAVYGVE